MLAKQITHDFIVCSDILYHALNYVIWDCFDAILYTLGTDRKGLLY